MTDIKIKRYADKENLKKLMKYSKDTFANNSEVVHKSGDETIADTKTFSKPIVGSVTGSSGSCTGNAATATTAGAVNTVVADGSTKDLVYAHMAGTDAFRIRCGGGSDAGYLEIATSDNGNEPIYVRQYNLDGGEPGTFDRIVRTLTLLDGSGNTTFPGTVTATTFSGNLNGNADTATKAVRADHATSADSATRATSADRASGADCVRTGYNEIRFDWDSQVPGYVGLRVDATDMGGIVTTNRLVSDIRAQWYAAYPDGAEAHNAMWGGRDITAAFDSGEFSEHIADGTFKDIFPGDFITKSITVNGTAYSVKWVIVELDYWLNTLGSTPVTAHHAVILPETPPFNAYMNSTNTTSGGYTQCAMYKNTIPAFAAGLTAAFGAGHILTFQEWFSSYTNDTVQSTAYGGWQGASTGWDGTEKSLSFTCNLMNSMMAFGAPIWSSSGFDSFSAVHQFAAFRMNPSLIYANRSWYWLRDVTSSSHFVAVDGDGSAGASYASIARGVRPFALLK